MKEPKFYKCAHCGNIITKIEDKGVPVFCCGQKMDELVPNTSDGAGEKHVPVVEVNGKEVKGGILDEVVKELETDSEYKYLTKLLSMLQDYDI